MHGRPTNGCGKDFFTLRRAGSVRRQGLVHAADIYTA
jgi:hypothetical protein